MESVDVLSAVVGAVSVGVVALIYLIVKMRREQVKQNMRWAASFGEVSRLTDRVHALECQLRGDPIPEGSASLVNLDP